MGDGFHFSAVSVFPTKERNGKGKKEILPSVRLLVHLSAREGIDSREEEKKEEEEAAAVAAPEWFSGVLFSSLPTFFPIRSSSSTLFLPGWAERERER